MTQGGQMTSVVSILERVQARAGLARRDGHPLYAYRVDDEALEALRQALARALGSRRALDGFACAGLCLFAAEHFCRTHAGGAWRWQEVFEAVGFDRGVQAWYRCMERGLRYWGRPLLQTPSQRQFLITMACEGGLPRQLLHREEQHLTRYLRRLLRDRERYSLTPTAELAGRHLEVLPVSLRNDTVQELCCLLVDEIARLRRLAGGEADVEALEARAPGWRQRLPLRLEDDVALRLLRGLLRAPRTEVGQERGLIRVAVTLAEAPLRIVRRLQLPPEMDPAALAGLLGVDEGALGARMQLSVHSANGAVQAVGSATRFDDGYRLVGLRRRGMMIDSLARLTLVVTAGTREIGRGEPDGGDEVSDALPWVFADDEEAAAQALVGMGSLRTTREWVRVLVPEGAALEAEDGADVRELGGIEHPRGRVVALRGSARVTVEDELYRVVTRAPEDTAQRYVLRGRHRNLGVGGSDLWHGLPRVLRAAGDELPVSVPASRVQWRHVGGGGGWRSGGAPAGDVVLHVVEDGETRFRARLTVVPEALRCRLLPGSEAGAGVIRLEQCGATDVSCEEAAGVSWEVERRGPGALDVNVRAAGAPPATLGLRLMFPSGGEARVTVPFPSAVPAFVDRGGRHLEDGAEVALRQLVGAFAVVHAPQPSSRFRLRCRLNKGGSGWEELADLRSESGEAVALSLDTAQDRVESLLTSVDALDAYVELRLTEIGTTTRVSVRVRHYEAALGREDVEDGAAVDVFLDESGMDALGEERVAALCVEARPIEAPGDTPVALPVVAAGRWRFDKRARAGGWLITGRIEALMVLRPFLVSVIEDEGAGDGEGAEVSEEVSALVRAVRFHLRDERMEALQGVVAGLGRDFGHPDWTRMMEYLDVMASLPATAFDAIRALARDPDAAVKALFQARRREHFDVIWDGLEDLPFAWKLVPVRCWVRAARDYRDSVVSALAGMELDALDPEALAREQLGKVIGWAEGRSLYLGWLRLLLHEVLGETPRPPEVAHKDRLQVLLRREEIWPQWRYPEKLEALLDQHQVPAECRVHNGLDHQHAVLNAPILAAAAAVDGHAFDDALIFELRRMRAFDEDWFEHAHAQAFFTLLNMRCTENPEFLG